MCKRPSSLGFRKIVLQGPTVHYVANVRAQEAKQAMPYNDGYTALFPTRRLVLNTVSCKVRRSQDQSRARAHLGLSYFYRLVVPVRAEWRGPSSSEAFCRCLFFTLDHQQQYEVEV